MISAGLATVAGAAIAALLFSGVARAQEVTPPDVLVAEESVPTILRDSLARRGHVIKLFPAVGAASAVTRSARGDGVSLSASSDPRKGGVPAAY